MTVQNYFVVQNSVVTNIVYWDGDTNTWQPPADATMLVEATTIAKTWCLDKDATPPTYVLVENVGLGNIGFTWDGTYLITNEPKPADPEPVQQPVVQPT